MPSKEAQQKLQLASQFLNTGGKEKAKTLIYDVLENDPRNADAWYLASFATDQPVEQINALNQALGINPRHKEASARLKQLLPGASIPPTSIKRKRSPTQSCLIVLLVLGGLYVLGKTVSPDYVSGPTITPSITLTPSITYTPSITFTPSATFTPSLTPIPSATPTNTPTLLPTNTITATATLSAAQLTQQQKENFTATRQQRNDNATGTSDQIMSNRTATAEVVGVTLTARSDSQTATTSSIQDTRTFFASYSPITAKELVSYADRHTSESVKISGSVSSIMKGSDDFQLSSGVELIYIANGTGDTVYPGDTVTVYGGVRGFVSGQNAFGATIQQAVIDADYIAKQ